MDPSAFSRMLQYDGAVTLLVLVLQQQQQFSASSLQTLKLRRCRVDEFKSNQR